MDPWKCNFSPYKKIQAGQGRGVVIEKLYLQYGKLKKPIKTSTLNFVRAVKNNCST